MLPIGPPYPLMWETSNRLRVCEQKDRRRHMTPNATKKWPPAPRRRVYLMRHGDVDYFAPDGRPYPPATVPLNDEGRLQAAAAGRELAIVPLDRAVTSGLRRSVETATIAL